MKRILLLYTGGTVGCEGEPLAPMSDQRFARCLAECGLMPTNVTWTLRALPQVRDSASMQPSDWLDVGELLLEAWADFDGFVVLHGTDTLAYTAAALSLLLAGQDKPVILTGSQLPLANAGSDAPGNIRDAVACAGAGVGAVALREVAVCFGGRVLRGNRCVKRSASDLEAFVSPNWSDLGSVRGGVVTMDAAALLPLPARAFDGASALAKLQQLRLGMAAHSVWAIHLTPGFPHALLNAALALPNESNTSGSNRPTGWVLACYGAGNATTAPEFLNALRAARDAGVPVVAVTQTGHGAVNVHTYAAGEGLALAGVMSGSDLSVPAAVVKLLWLLARACPVVDMPDAMRRAVAGEVS